MSFPFWSLLIITPHFSSSPFLGNPTVSEIDSIPSCFSSQNFFLQTAHRQTSQELIGLGGFIDMPETEFEAMHPRFTAVNMYRRMCERENIDFKKNLVVDNIGIALEEPYDDARTKYNKKK